MKFFAKLRSFFFGKSKEKKASEPVVPQTPSLTILMAINPSDEDKAACEAHLAAEAEKLAFLNPKTVLIDTITSYDDYQRFCKDDLCKSFDTDFVLVIQHDTKILDVSAWDNDFFNYDYIGAPWSLDLAWIKKFLVSRKKDPENKDLYVGNGGFSLRSKKLCELAAKKNAETENKFHEDTFLCCNFRDFFEQNGMKFAPYEVAKKFSVENDEYTGQFGAHKNVLKDGKKVPVKDL